MANTLTTALVQPLTNMVSKALRQKAGIINSITMDDSADIGYNQSKTLPRPDDLAVSDFTPGVNAPSANDVTTPGNTLTVNQRKEVRWHLTGEEARALKSNEASFTAEQTANAINKAVQHLEDAVRTTLTTGAGYAVKTGGTNPFDSTGKLDVATDANVTLTNAGVDIDERSMILGPNAEGRYLNLDNNNKVNESGDPNIRTEGDLGRLFRFAMRSTPKHASFTKSTAASYTNNGAISQDDISFTAQSGSNDFKAGDILTFAGATYKYVVKSYDTTSKLVTLNAPFLEDIDDATNITVETSDNRDFAVQRQAAKLLVRPDELAQSELRASDSTIITDPMTGISMRLSIIPGVGLSQWQLSFVYGSAIWVPEASVIVPGN